MRAVHPRNLGEPLDLDRVLAIRVNRSAAERRAATIPTRRTVKKEWQAAWLLRAITLIDLTTLSGDDSKFLEKSVGRPVFDSTGRTYLWRNAAKDAIENPIMGIGPAPAIRGVLRQSGVALEAVGRFEINEAFGAQYLAVERELGLDRDRVNVHGGAIALGHPLGATGVRCTLTLAREMRAGGVHYGVSSACCGGGH